jgi:uncharacterized protein
MKAPL